MKRRIGSPMSDAYELLLCVLIAAASLACGLASIAWLNALCAEARPHAMGETLTHLLCLALGAALTWVVQYVRHRPARRALPPATARQLARDARANRLESRPRWIRRSAGELPPSRWIPLPRDGFADDEDTH